MKIKLDKKNIEYLVDHGVEVLWAPDVVMIDDSSVFEPPCSIKWMQIEHTLRLGAFSYAVSGYFSSVNIGRYCSIGEQVQIGRSDHPTTWLSTHPFQYLQEQLFRVGKTFTGADQYHQYSPKPQPVGIEATSIKPTYIGNDVWIGHGAMIRPGVTIGNGAIIGAHAVVTKDVEPYAIVVGNPGHQVKKRFSDEIIDELQRIQWWRFAPWQLEAVPFYDIEKALKYLQKLVPLLSEYSPEVVMLLDNNARSFSGSFTEFASTNKKNKCASHHDNSDFITEPFLHAQNRQLADSYFSSLEHEKALLFYIKSIKENEDGLLYSYLNAATLVSAVFARYYLAAKWLIYAKRLIAQDPGYFDIGQKRILKSILDSGNGRLYHYLAFRLGYARQKVSFSDFKCLILGFPRCGTSSVAKNIAKKLKLNSGLTSESLLRIDLPCTRERLWESFLDSFSYAEAMSQGCFDGFIDKSTGISLSRDLIIDVKNKFPEALVVICRRNGYDRAVSAYQRCANQNGYDFPTNVSNEVLLINNLGGVKNIFNSISVFSEYCRQMGEIGLDYPIVYPTVVMENFEELLSEIGTDWIVFFDIDTKKVSKPVEYINLNELESMNSSETKINKNDILTVSVFRSALKSLTI